ncbi:hypothetical protein GALMADRAFT_76714 [Galerina marginata CBS 339.88]|uniref:Major facilitator superfamily (MFS) profile domain-containing protein n=1 Tax=Galerina marginata (strain CBS 339.88) TaxID=685588 RepID=A0A067SG67_GALM3|nr:hypothetical protein GALMADRAFT_76714 [Galerina marginata CBS 339.88]
MTKASTLTDKGEDIVVLNVKGEEEELEDLEEVIHTFPEGGLRAWTVIVAGYINSFGVYQDFYVRQYLRNFSPSAIGWIGGVQIFLNFSLGAITGRVFDRGYSCTILYAISLFTLSLSHENSYYQVFLTNGVGLGVASGISYTASFAITGHYFIKKRALVVGIVSSGSALGAIIHPIMLNRLINGSVGFHNGVRISAAMNVFLLAVASCLMRTRLPPKEKQTFPILQWVREPAYLALLVGAVFCFTGLFFSAFYLQLDAITHGVPKTFAFYGLSILNAASFFGRTVSGYFASRLGVFNLGAFFTAGTGVVVLCMIAMKDTTGVILFAVFFGIFSGGCVGLGSSMLANTAKDANEVGTRLGVYFGIGGILGLFATPISGALLTTHYHWTRTIIFAGVNMLLAGGCFFIARHYIAKLKGTQRV